MAMYTSSLRVSVHSDIKADLQSDGYINIPERDLIHLNRSVSGKEWQRLPEELGGGYAALIDVFHQLHCLV